MNALLTYLPTGLKYFFPKKLPALVTSDEQRKNLDINPASAAITDSSIVRLRT